MPDRTGRKGKTAVQIAPGQSGGKAFLRFDCLISQNGEGFRRGESAFENPRNRHRVANHHRLQVLKNAQNILVLYSFRFEEIESDFNELFRIFEIGDFGTGWGIHFPCRRRYLGVRMDRLCTLKEIAGLLNVSHKTVYYWVARREIPFLKVGRHLRFESVSVLEYFSASSRDAGLDCRTKTGSVQPIRSRWGRFKCPRKVSGAVAREVIQAPVSQ